MKAERRRVIFSGRVQGVGFRLTAVHLGQGLALAGTVRNMPDGAVELVVDGSPADIDGLIRRLGEHFAEQIRSIQQETTTPQAPAAPVQGIQIVH